MNVQKQSLAVSAELGLHTSGRGRVRAPFSAAAALFGHHVGLDGELGVAPFQLHHLQVLVLQGHAAQRAAQGRPALLVAVQQDGVVVRVGQGEAAGALAVVDGGRVRGQHIVLQRHSQWLQPARSPPSRTFLAPSGRALTPLLLPGPQHRLQGLEEEQGAILRLSVVLHICGEKVGGEQ